MSFATKCSLIVVPNRRLARTKSVSAPLTKPVDEARQRLAKSGNARQYDLFERKGIAFSKHLMRTPMTAVPNLYLKWRAFRAMFPDERADADYANLVFVDDEIDGRASKFSKLLKGDVGMKPRIAEELARIINDDIVAFRTAHGLPIPAAAMIARSDLALPLYEFVRRLVTVAEKVDAGRLENLHNLLLELIAPWRSRSSRAPRLLIDGGERIPWVEAEEPIEFQVGELGCFTIADMPEDPLAAYVFAARDPAPIGRHLWDLKWSQTFLWLPSPFVPVRQGAFLALTEPEAIRPMLGRFHVTAVLVFDPAIAGKLDPRGKVPPMGALDEAQTSRFIINLQRLEERNPQSLAIATNEYVVVQP
jgi:hypothetical protein